MPDINLPALPNGENAGGGLTITHGNSPKGAPANPVGNTPPVPDALEAAAELPHTEAIPAMAENGEPTDPNTNVATEGTEPPALPVIALPTPEGMPEPAQAQMVPALPMPGMLPIPGATPEVAAVGQPEAIELPEISVEREEKKVKSWQTVLKNQVIPPKTNFNYRRVLLPSTIYRDEYSRDNQHLPRRETRDDYAFLLFKSVARNDVETARALLNAGTAINVLNVYGETPLAFAKRSGATEVAQLLKARGAR